MTEHIASVVNDYRAALSWAARCSCGWEELHSLAVVADRAAENHMRQFMFSRCNTCEAVLPDNRYLKCRPCLNKIGVYPEDRR